MMKLIYVSVFILLFGCGKLSQDAKDTSANSSIETTSEDVEVTETIELNVSELSIYFSASPHAYLHYQLGIADLWLENAEGEFIQLISDDAPQSLMLNFGEAVNQSHFLMRTAVPVGEYTALVTFIDYELAQIVLQQEAEVIQPFLFDEVGEQLIEDNSLQPIRIQLNQKLTVEATENPVLSFHLDSESSLRYMPFEENANDWLSTPHFQAMPGVRYSQAIIYQGVVSALTEDSIDFIAHTSYGLAQNTTRFSFQQPQLFYNAVPISLTELMSKPIDKLMVEITASVDQGQLTIQQLDFFAETLPSLVKLSGVVNQSRFVGTLIDLDSMKTLSLPVFVDLPFPLTDRPQVISGVASYQDNQLTDAYFNNKTTTMVFDQITDQQTNVQSFARLSKDFLQNTNNMRVSGERATDDTYVTEGKFDNGQWQSVKTHNLDQVELQFSFSLPLINTTNPLTINNNLIEIESLDFAIKALKVKGQPLYLDVDENQVDRLQLNNTAGCIQLQRIEPFIEISCYQDQAEFINALKEYVDNGFTPNYLFAEGEWQTAGFEVNRLNVILNIDTAFNEVAEEVLTEADVDVLRGRNFGKFISKISKPFFKRMLSRPGQHKKINTSNGLNINLIRPLTKQQTRNIQSQLKKEFDKKQGSLDKLTRSKVQEQIKKNNDFQKKWKDVKTLDSFAKIIQQRQKTSGSLYSLPFTDAQIQKLNDKIAAIVQRNPEDATIKRKVNLINRSLPNKIMNFNDTQLINKLPNLPKPNLPSIRPRR